MLANTSKSAYQSIKSKLGDKQRAVYQAVKDCQPITNDKLAEVLGWEINRVTGRVNELSQMGYLAHEGYAMTKSGRKAKTWVADEPKAVKEKVRQAILLDTPQVDWA